MVAWNSKKSCDGSRCLRPAAKQAAGGRIKGRQGGCAKAGRFAEDRNVAFGLPRTSDHAEIEGIGSRLRNIFTGHATDHEPDQSDLPRTRNPDARPGGLSSQTARAVAGEADRAGTSATRPMALRATGPSQAPA